MNSFDNLKQTNQNLSKASWLTKLFDSWVSFVCYRYYYCTLSTVKVELGAKKFCITIHYCSLTITVLNEQF
jgi:hypothetical protein